MVSASLPPLATMDTMTEEQVEELWTRTVKRTPTMRPTIGLEMRTLSWNIEPAIKTYLIKPLYLFWREINYVK